MKKKISKALKSTDFSAVFGAEYNLAYGIFLSARYNLGLTRINEESDDDDYLKTVPSLLVLVLNLAALHVTLATINIKNSNKKPCPIPDRVF